MHEYHSKATGILDSFPDSQYKTSLKQLVQFTINRTK
jgi:octaprenyl-diphosphate synthase